MKKTVFLKKVNSLMPDLKKQIIHDCEYLYNSGGIDTDAFGDNYALPKIILTVVLEKMAKQYTPFNEDYRKEIANLRHF